MKQASRVSSLPWTPIDRCLLDVALAWKDAHVRSYQWKERSCVLVGLIFDKPSTYESHYALILGRFISDDQTQHYIHAFSMHVRDVVDDMMTLVCTLQRALWSCADVMICHFSFTVNTTNHLSSAYSIYMQFILSIVEILSTRWAVGKKEVV